MSEPCIRETGFLPSDLHLGRLYSHPTTLSCMRARSVPQRKSYKLWRSDRPHTASMHLLHLSFEFSSVCTCSQHLWRDFVGMGSSSLWIRFVKLECKLATHIRDFQPWNMPFSPIFWTDNLAHILRLWHVINTNHGSVVVPLQKLFHTLTNTSLSSSHVSTANVDVPPITLVAKRSNHWTI